MDKQEAVKIIREHLPAELVEPVLEALDVPIPASGVFDFAQIYHVSAKVGVLFDVDAWSEAEAVELVNMAVKAKPVLYGAFGKEVYGRIHGDPEIEGVVEKMVEEGDDPLMDLSDSYGY